LMLLYCRISGVEASADIAPAVPANLGRSEKDHSEPQMNTDEHG